jgi:hypothetical protein
MVAQCLSKQVLEFGLIELLQRKVIKIQTNANQNNVNVMFLFSNQYRLCKRDKNGFLLYIPEDPVFGTPDKSWKQIFF